MSDSFDIFSPQGELRAAAEQYAGLGQILSIFSELFVEEIYLISTEALRPLLPSKKSPHYLPREIILLASLGPEELKKVHLVKKMFQGEVVEEKISHVAEP
jgi:hypothetical protein